MRRALLSILLAGAGVLALSSPAAAASPSACNQGTVRAHATVPHNPKASAHENIPHC